MRIGITYDLRADYLAQGMSGEDTAEFDSEITIVSICRALAGLGHQPVRIGNIAALNGRLAAGERWHAVFNICEGMNGFAREAQVPCLLEAFGIPAFFSDALTLAVSLDKGWTKRILRDAGIPTAPFAVIEAADEIARVDLPYPLFVKPVAEGSGKGVNARSRVGSPDELRHVATALLERFCQPVLVETYLPGREFTVGIVGTGAEARVLGVVEISPTEHAAGVYYGYENKEKCDANVVYRLVEGREAVAAGEVALDAWRLLRCRDGGRIDVRNDERGKPQFVEVNPLAGLNPEHSDLCFLAGFKGYSYQQLIGLIVESFLRRNPALARMAPSTCAA
jgi:D-alanine-D-alanine ligase